MGCSKCGNLSGCGCTDTALTTVPTVPGPLCVDPEPCSETISSDCVIYAGPDSDLPCGILHNDRLTVVIEKLLACDGSGFVLTTSDDGNVVQVITPIVGGVNLDASWQGILVQKDGLTTLNVPAGFTHFTIGNYSFITNTGPGNIVQIQGGLDEVVKFDANGYPVSSLVVKIDALGVIKSPTFSFPSSPSIVPSSFWFEDDAFGNSYLVRLDSFGNERRVQLT